MLQRETDYSIKVSFSVATRAVEGLYDGTIHLRQGTKTIPQTLKVRINVTYGRNVPSPNAVTLSPDSLSLISGVAPNHGGIYFSQANSELSMLMQGDILALPPALGIPRGFLGKIVGITNSGNHRWDEENVLTSA
jgi:hypothetical protein